MLSPVLTIAEDSPAAVAFQARDADKDSVITVDEFVAADKAKETILRRDFRVFDADSNGRLSEAEFRSIPYWGTDAQRGPIADPIVDLAQSHRRRLLERWSDWDTDQSGELSVAEFAIAKLPDQVAGLEGTQFSDWDRNGDSSVSAEEVGLLMEIACGVRISTGELVRSPAGDVLDLRMLRNLHPDANWKVRREDYIKAMGSEEAAVKWFPSVKSDSDERFSVTEFMASGHRTGPVRTFLDLDRDLNARLSRQEMEGLPQGWGPPGRNWLAGFDDDMDGEYSLRELQMLPHVNLLVSWHSAQDADGDGKLSLQEFWPAVGVELAALAVEYFRRLDVDRNGFLTLTEWPFHTSHPEAKFGALDTNSDGNLTLEEFLAEGSLPAERLRRDFHVFDNDGNERLTRTEFLAIPHWVRDDLRISPPDPVTQLAEGHFAKLKAKWADWDLDHDGQLSSAEFRTAAFARTIPGLEMSSFADWDRNHDNRLSEDEAAQLLEIACGVRSPTGEFLRSTGTGRVVDWRGFQALKPDRNGKVSRDAYIKSMGPKSDPKHWFSNLFKSDATTFGVTEFATSNHRTDPISQFLVMDKDLDGHLSSEEMKALPVGWGPPGREWLAGFDDDGDGRYSLHEFRRIPHINILTTWHSAQDRNHDGTLSPAEFQFLPAPALATLSAEYFRRLDTDRDGKLSIAEWEFSFDPARAPRSVILAKRDLDGDERLSLEEVQGDLRRQAASGPAHAGRETALVRIEEAFRRADANDDGYLNLAELSSDDGLETVAPGAAIRAKSTPLPPTIAVGNFLGMDEQAVRLIAIVGFNILLVVGVAVYVYRKRGEKHE